MVGLNFQKIRTVPEVIKADEKDIGMFRTQFLFYNDQFRQSVVLIYNL